MSRVRIISSWLVLGCLVVAAPAHAQDREAARADFRTGIEALEAGDFANAELAFRRSIATYPTTAARCNLALTYDRWGRVEEAIAAYDECALNDSTSSGHYGQHAAERAAELRAQLEAARAAVAPPAAPTTEPAPAPITPAPAAEPTLTPVGSAPSAISYRQAPPEASPSRAFLWLGLTSTILGGVGILSGALLASAATADVEELEAAGYPMSGDRYLIPADDPGADTLSAAESKSNAAIGLYVSGGILGALGVTFFVLQAVTTSADDDAPDAQVSVFPVEGGAMVSGRVGL